MVASSRQEPSERKTSTKTSIWKLRKLTAQDFVRGLSTLAALAVATSVHFSTVYGLDLIARWALAGCVLGAVHIVFIGLSIVLHRFSYLLPGSSPKAN